MRIKTMTRACTLGLLEAVAAVSIAHAVVANDDCSAAIVIPTVPYDGAVQSVVGADHGSV